MGCGSSTQAHPSSTKSHDQAPAKPSPKTANQNQDMSASANENPSPSNQVSAANQNHDRSAPANESPSPSNQVSATNQKPTENKPALVPPAGNITRSNGVKPATAALRETKAELLKDLQNLRQRMKDNDNASIEEKKKILLEYQQLLEKITSKLSQADPKKGTIMEVMKGKFDLDCPSLAKVVRIFTSSTFTDTGHERNALMERVYPRLKDFCRELGYEFQVVDMRWGIREEATNDHMTTELCQRELDACKQLSTGPNFVTFLSHKYGYRPLPRVIDSSEFETIQGGITNPAALQMLNRWYKKDENAVPAAYILQPVSTHLPDFISSDKDKFTAAKDTWWSENELMQDALEASAKQLITDPSVAEKYIVSVTETEISSGILRAKDSRDHCHWFKRTFTDIEGSEPSRQLGRYTDARGSPEQIEQAKHLLHELKEEKISSCLPSENITEYKVHWNENGIDPDNNKEHNDYINKLCVDFETQIKALIKKGITSRTEKELSNATYLEAVQHIAFCQTKCKTFYGREDVLAKIEEYVKGPSKAPLVIHGPSGSGKTSIMAVAASKIQKWLPGSAVIIRFLGTTPDSSTISGALLSVMDQISWIYTGFSKNIQIKDLKQDFYLSTRFAKKGQPLVILLDSLDQLDITGGARQMSWLHTTLRDNVKIIVSTLPEEQYECLPKLQIMIRDEKSFISVPVLAENEVSNIITKWLEIEKRALTPTQKEVVVSAFKSCPIPLFLKLCFDQACRWASFWHPEQTVLQHTVRDIINMLFSRVELMHGKLLVSHMLGYMTTSRGGLSEGELEDLLSLDDDVLNDVYQFWTPPLRRLPPLLLVRIKNDLQQYLVERGSDGVRVLYWYHRQFIEAANDRYCSSDEKRKFFHTAIAEYFLGTWAGKEKPYTDKNGTSQSADRHIAQQPLKFETSYNTRKLMELPIHLIKSDQLTLLKKQVLFSFDWLDAKVKGTSLRNLLDDLMAARDAFPDESEFYTLAETLQLSRDAINYDTNLLPVQISNRIMNLYTESKDLTDLYQQCQNPPYPIMMPDQPLLTPPGGQLIHALTGHTKDIVCVTMTQDGKIAVSGDEKTLRVWDIQQGTNTQTISTVGSEIQSVKLADQDKYIVVSAEKSVLIIRLDTGEILHRIGFGKVHGRFTAAPVCTFGENKEKIALLWKSEVYGYEVATGQQLWKVTDPYLDSSSNMYDSNDLCDGNDRYVVICHYNGRFFKVLDTTTQQFIHNVRVFPEPKDDDDDDLTTDALAVRKSKNQLVLATFMNNDLRIYDIVEGKLVKEIPGDKSGTSDKFFISRSEQFLYSLDSKGMLRVDLDSGVSTKLAQHNASVEMGVTIDDVTMVTVASDNLVRIWDLSRRDVSFHTEDTMLISVPKQKKEIRFRYSDILPLPGTSRYFLFKISVSPVNGLYLIIYDLKTKQIVRQAKVTQKMFSVKVVDDARAVVACSRSIRVLGLQKMEWLRHLTGNMSYYNCSFELVKTHSVLSVTRGRHNLRLSDIETGTTYAILKAGQSEKIDDIKVSPGGEFAAASTEEGPLLLFDLTSHQLLHELNPFEDELYLTDALFSADGRFFSTVHSISLKPLKLKETQCSVPVVFSTKDGSVVHKGLVDVDGQRHLEEKKSDNSVGVYSVCLVKDNVIATACEDTVIRVFNMETGVMITALRGHTHDVSTLEATSDGSRLISWSCVDAEQVFRVWDTETWSFIVSFKMEIDWNELHPLKDGSAVIGGIQKNGQPIIWSLMGEDRSKYEVSDKEPEMFKGKVLDAQIQTEFPDDDKIDPEDPDDEDQEEEDKYSDDEDEEDEKEDEEEDLPIDDEEDLGRRGR